MPQKAAPTNRALVTFLLDRSGSMSSIKDATIEAFNAYVETLKADKDTAVDFTFLQFDSVSLDKVCVAEPVKDMKSLNVDTFVPRGSTPLIDAAVKTIRAVDESLTKRDDKPKVIVCIQTDGQENCSTEHTWAELNALIKEKSAQGWQFNFMGAGIDAYEQGRRMGISAGATLSYNSADKAATRAAFAASAGNTMLYARGMAESVAYTDMQKSAAGDKFWAGTTPAAGKPTAPDLSLRAALPPKPAASIVDDFKV